MCVLAKFSGSSANSTDGKNTGLLCSFSDYLELVDYMSSAPIIAAILEKENAVADFRDLMGMVPVSEIDGYQKLKSMSKTHKEYDHYYQQFGQKV